MSKIELKSDICMREVSVVFQDRASTPVPEQSEHVPPNNRRLAAAFVLVVVAIALIHLFIFFKNNLGLIISFNILGLAIAALNASLDKDPNYDKEEARVFFRDYFYFVITSVLVGTILYIALERLNVMSINRVAYYLVGLTGSIYLMSHIDYLRNHFLFFFKTNLSSHL